MTAEINILQTGLKDPGADWPNPDCTRKTEPKSEAKKKKKNIKKPIMDPVRISSLTEIKKIDLLKKRVHTW